MRPQPTVDELRQPGFELLARLGHQDLAPFLGDYYWKRRSWVVIGHYALSLACLAAWVAASLRSGLGLDGWLTSFGLAALSMLPLLPIHEAIHALAYKLLGAPDVRFGGSLRRLYAYTIAHRFVVAARPFVWVALAPFGLISAALLILAALLPGSRPYWLALLLIHTGGTSGDWALLNYLWLQRRRRVYTYDDADERASYFYAGAER